MESFDTYAWVILPFIVFFARIADVTLGTLRIIFTSRGKRNIAPILGFVEVFIWIVVVGQIVKNVHSFTAYFGYAAGFAAGTYIGMKIEEKLALGTLVLRIILAEGGDEMAHNLREAGYGLRPLAITPTSDRYGYSFQTSIELTLPANLKQEWKMLKAPPRPADDGSLERKK